VLVLEGGGSCSLDVSLAYHEETEDCQEVRDGNLERPSPRKPTSSPARPSSSSWRYRRTRSRTTRPSTAHSTGRVDVRSNEAGRDTHERVRIEVEAAEAAPSEDGFAPVRAPQPDEAALAGPREKQRQRTNWFARAFLAAGVLALAFGVVWLVLTVRFVADADRTTGTVVDVESSTDADGYETFYPVVRFTTADGREVEFRSDSGSSSPPSTGNRVDVLYDPDDPQDAELSGFLDLWVVGRSFRPSSV
jgi:Protein of unknown function (DUF3592)